IVCYYVVPANIEFKRDKDQFESLTGEVDSFYLASPRNLFEHLKKASNTEIPFLYLYVTSHGSKPQGEAMHTYFRSKDKFSKEPHKKIDFLTEKFPDYYNQYFISFDATASGRANHAMRLHALKEKQQPEDIILTPRYLKEMLSEIRAEVKKYIILQGCYTGSFISTNENMVIEQDSLKSIPNICLMTASRYDRQSFGCAPGPDRTYFGGTFNDLLETQKQRLEAIAWDELYEKIKETIEQIEFEKEIQINKRSLPSYFNNIGS
ncbi:MAG: hypothetical protein GY729_05235, partial [Desulfobacteraceae bacterium]|nr:hypothetical protein [Desulfobacteraceae bacterium]